MIRRRGHDRASHTIVTGLKRKERLLARVRYPSLAAAALAGAAFLHACGEPRAAPEPFYATKFERRPDVARMTAIGRRLFFDPSLSASGRTACASCHDPAHAYGPPNARAVQLAGAHGRTPGVRAAPSLRYVQTVPPFSAHYFETDGDDSIDQGPTGGHGWDGRARSLHEQAAIPLLSPFEMANRDAAEVVERARRSSSAPALREAFGAHVLDDVDRALRAILLCLEVFQQDPAQFYPYDSKYDAFLRGEAALSGRERRGLALFNDPAKGNCASCHPSAIRNGAFPAFTDWGFVALGVPRNRAVAGAFRDLGLCGPLRKDLAGHKEYCGMFRTPSLRNVATRRVFFHNGRFTRLEDAVRFYAERDSNPARWYPRLPDGRIDAYDDIPPSLRANVNRAPPFGGAPGAKPALDRAEIGDIVAFLRTLTDGYRVGAGS